jgi:hypothetical protein
MMRALAVLGAQSSQVWMTTSNAPLLAWPIVIRGPRLRGDPHRTPMPSEDLKTPTLKIRT